MKGINTMVSIRSLKKATRQNVDFIGFALINNQLKTDSKLNVSLSNCMVNLKMISKRIKQKLS